jgi:RNA polymerase sigma factor (sigma-70 family)
VSQSPFQAVLDAHAEDVYRFLLAAVGPQDADDCWQETFLSALRAYPRVKRTDNLRGWVFTIAHRKALDVFRRRSRNPVPVDVVHETGATASADGDPTLWQAVRMLPPKQRAAILHRYVSDLPYKNIADLIGTTPAAARQNVRAGLKKLREEYTND